MNTPASASVQASNPWTDLGFPLSLNDIKRLTWLRTKVEARVFLAQTQERVSNREAARLAFAKHLADSGRISEWMVQP